MADLYQTVTDKILTQMERGKLEWRMPWHSRADSRSPLALPVNVTGRNYRGGNVPLLWSASQAFDYPSPVWGTYTQWQQRGAQVRKGEKSTLVLFWKKLSVYSSNESDDDESGDETTEGNGASRSTRLIARGYSVFNAAQVDGFDESKIIRKPSAANLPESERVALAESFFENVPVPVHHGGNRAFYSPSRDYIALPGFAQFKDAVAYYATRGHETVHATGHESRCNREFGKRFGDNAYAFEELVAELGAAYLCANLGLTNEPREDHAAYLQGWLKALKEDRWAFFAASSRAQQACDYLLNLQPKAEDVECEDLAEDLPLAA